jgi:hypothetical protein
VLLYQASNRWYGCARKARTPLALSNWVNGVSIWQTSWIRSSTEMLSLCFFSTFINFSGEIHIILRNSMIIFCAPFLQVTVGHSPRRELNYFSCVVLCSSWRCLYKFCDFSNILIIAILFSLYSKASIPNSLHHLPVLWGYKFPIYIFQNCEKRLSFAMANCASVCLSAWNNSAPTGWNCMMILIWRIFEHRLIKYNFHSTVRIITDNFFMNKYLHL